MRFPPAILISAIRRGPRMDLPLVKGQTHDTRPFSADDSRNRHQFPFPLVRSGQGSPRTVFNSAGKSEGGQSHAAPRRGAAQKGCPTVRLCQPVRTICAPACSPAPSARAFLAARPQRASVDPVRSEGRLSHPLSPALTLTGTSTDQRQHRTADRLRQRRPGDDDAGKVGVCRVGSGLNCTGFCSASGRRLTQPAR